MYKAWVFCSFPRVPHNLLGTGALRICAYRVVHPSKKCSGILSVTASQASWQSGFQEGMLRYWKQGLLGFCVSSGVNQAISLEWSDILQIAFFPEENTVKNFIIKRNLLGFDCALLC